MLSILLLVNLRLVNLHIWFLMWKHVDLPVDQGKAMREQAVLREEMQYHYRLGNKEVIGFL
jgi:hypothetical protein